MAEGARGKVVLIAGGAKNLGGLLSRSFAEDGARAVVVHHHGDSSADDAGKTAEQVRTAGAEALVVAGDLSRPAQVSALFDRAIDAFGGVDIAVNTVGRVLRKPIVETTEDEYDGMFDVNAKAAYFFLTSSSRSAACGSTTTAGWSPS